MNKKQRVVMLIGIAVILFSFLIWQSAGGELFTQTEVLVSKYDEFFKRNRTEFEDKFIWGLDLTLIVSGITLLICGYAYNKFNKM